MKQGQILNRIVMLLLFAGVVLYLGVSAWNAFTGKMVTTKCYAFTLNETQEATGFLAREEYVLETGFGLADVLPAEGEKVGVGEAVAYLYKDAAALERKQELRALGMEQEQLMYTLTRTDGLADNAKLTREIMTSLAGLRTSVAERSFTSLEEDVMNLKSLVYKRDYTYDSGGDLTALQARAAALEEQIRALKSAAAADTTAVRTDRSGVFSGLVDGYENLLTPAVLQTLSPSELDKLARNAPNAASGAIGKLITSSRWYFVCTLSEAEARRMAEGFRVTVRFSRDWAGEVEMEVERVSAPENGRVTVVFSTTRFLSETTLLRRQTVDIIFSTVSGVRVQKNALYQNEAGEWGVYAVIGAQAEFKPVNVVGEDGDFYLVQPVIPATDLDKNEAKRALRPGDEIIVSAEGLFDGKVVRQ